jgi:hypothetical protein
MDFWSSDLSSHDAYKWKVGCPFELLDVSDPFYLFSCVQRHSVDICCVIAHRQISYSIEYVNGCCHMRIPEENPLACLRDYQF